MRFRLSILRALTLAATIAAVGVTSACRSATEPAERIFVLDVAATRVPCTGMYPQECLLVRERPDAPYTYFYGAITGFTYEPGYRYMLQVGQRTVVNPPADAPSLAYRLIAVLSKTPASP